MPRLSTRVYSLLAALLVFAAAAQAQEPTASASFSCSDSGPEPARSAAWGVAFCNRTPHDLVIQFRDNDCPVDHWLRRGDVYERTLRAGETTTVSLCYAYETQRAGLPDPGVPELRIPGGRGVVTTWSVVGDCGDRSNRARLDAQTFYDRGNYKTGIVLLQHPTGASHCAGAEPTAAKSAPLPPAPSAQASPAAAAARASAPTREAAAPSASSTPQPAPTAAAAALPSAPPSFRAVIDTQDRLTRTVHIFATNAAGAAPCRLTLSLDFSDGSSWVDRLQAPIHEAHADALIATRKYGKSVTKVELSSPRCG